MVTTWTPQHLAVEDGATNAISAKVAFASTETVEKVVGGRLATKSAKANRNRRPRETRKIVAKNKQKRSVTRKREKLRKTKRDRPTNGASRIGQEGPS